ncbi:hypothetical protein F4678DRAFT_460347 [Xylaria arbuscula]|nr:hypothetical protein F4678DRAFT_460347 [Xylaria arbuscula]
MERKVDEAFTPSWDECFDCDGNILPGFNFCVDCGICRRELAITKSADEDHEVFTMLPCGHVFGFECLSIWFSTHATCPTCREKWQHSRCGHILKPEKIQGGKDFNIRSLSKVIKASELPGACGNCHSYLAENGHVDNFIDFDLFNEIMRNRQEAMEHITMEAQYRNGTQVHVPSRRNGFQYNPFDSPFRNRNHPPAWQPGEQNNTALRTAILDSTRRVEAAQQAHREALRQSRGEFRPPRPRHRPISIVRREPRQPDEVPSQSIGENGRENEPVRQNPTAALPQPAEISPRNVVDTAMEGLTQLHHRLQGLAPSDRPADEAQQAESARARAQQTFSAIMAEIHSANRAPRPTQDVSPLQAPPPAEAQRPARWQSRSGSAFSEALDDVFGEETLGDPRRGRCLRCDQRSRISPSYSRRGSYGWPQTPADPRRGILPTSPPPAPRANFIASTWATTHLNRY